MIQSKLDLQPIGVIRTPFKSKYAAPRQPASATGKTVGVITLNEHCNFEQALHDLHGFDYIWVLFWFHKNKNWKPKVLPPHSGRTKRGLFSTRSPHRPNPIGMSLCRLIDIRGRTIRIENPDMLDGTPLLDIKPYLPHAESHPKARAGWINESNELSTPLYRVVFTGEVRKSLRGMEDDEQREVETYLTGLLSSDPFPHVYRRIKKHDEKTSIVAVKRWRFIFSIEGTTVRVFGVAHSNERGGGK
jgi:tRNA-Thr(GGU) m(6)t(6)A37 methyltransferase TsaA